MRKLILKKVLRFFEGFGPALLIFILLGGAWPSPVHANPPGTFDVLGFGNSLDGFLTLDLSLDDRFMAVALQDDGKIVAVGTTHTSGSNDFLVARFNSDGSLDSSFNPNGTHPGFVVNDFSGSGSFDSAQSVVLQPDGKIVVAGVSSTCGLPNFAVARYTTDGSLDSSFTAPPPMPCTNAPPAGVVITQFSPGSSEIAFSVSLHPADDPNEGKIVGLGYTTNQASIDFAVARYCPSGSLDNGSNCGGTGFGTGGLVTTNFVDFFGTQLKDEGRAVLIQPGGKILAAGFSNVNGTEDFALVRYNSDGTNDATFGTNSIVVTDFNGGDDQCNAIALQPDGKIVAAGGRDLTGDPDFALARYCPNGLLDEGSNCGGLGFGSGGKDSTKITTNLDRATGVALQEDGKIVVAGLATIDSGPLDVDPVLARYLSNGDLDSTFNPLATLPSFPGLTVSPIADQLDQFTAAALQKDGKIVAVGSSQNGNNQDFLIARYLGDSEDLTPPEKSNPAEGGQGEENGGGGGCLLAQGRSLFPNRFSFLLMVFSLVSFFSYKYFVRRASGGCGSL